MTYHSSDSTESIENRRRSETGSRALDSDQNRVAAAMRELKKTGTSIYFGPIITVQTALIMELLPVWKVSSCALVRTNIMLLMSNLFMHFS